MGVKAAFLSMMALCLALTSCNAAGDAVRKDGEIFVLKGTVRVVGNEPFTRLVLTVPPAGEGGRPADHVVTGPLAGELRNRYQGKVVTVECRRCADSVPGPLPCIEPERIVGVE